MILGKLKVFEGVPSPYDKKKRQVVPSAIKASRLKSFRPFCNLGDICTGVGWKKGTLVDTLEEKRKQRAKAFYDRKLAAVNATRQAENLPQLKAIKGQLEAFGY